MSTSAVVISRNEGAWLERTCKSIIETGDVDELIHVDDASSPPEKDLSALGVKQFRMPKRVGAAIARAYGMSKASEKHSTILTCDSHMLWGQGDALAALLEEKERFKSLGALQQTYTPATWELQAALAPHKIASLAKAAESLQGIAYSGPCSQGEARTSWDNGLLRVGWVGHHTDEPVETSCMNGGNYMFSRAAFEKMGGYVQLPGHFGFEEEATAFVAAGLRIKFVCVNNISPWHVYRSQGCDPIPRPYRLSEDSHMLNLAATYRIAFKRLWKSDWRKRLLTRKRIGQAAPVPKHVIARLEKMESFIAYCDVLQDRFELREEDLLDALEQRRLNDQQRIMERERCLTA